MATRPQLDPARVSTTALTAMEGFHADTVREVAAAIEAHDVVVVGMAQNPFVKKARSYLTEANVSFHYLEYGSYLSEWKRRLAVKMWSGWPTFPQVFVKGELVGGADETKALIETGALAKKVGASS